MLEHRSAESEGLGFDSSWRLGVFSLAHARNKTKNIFLYFFAKLKTCQEPWIFDMTVEVAMKQLWIWNQKTCSLNEMVSPFFVGCGGMLNGTSGTFRSPGYLTQLKYDDNLDCSWTLLIPSDGYLTLIFVEFETEEWWVKIYQPSTCNLPSPLVDCVHPLLCAPTVTFLFL